jgi:hypothetical protein
MSTSSTGSASPTLRKIGNFFGLKVREILELVSTKANQSDLDAIPRFFEAGNTNEMISLNNVRIGDFCLRSDSKTGYRLAALPSTDISKWVQVFAAANASISKSVPFDSSIAPIIVHSMNLIPNQVNIVDSTGRINIAAWQPIDTNSIQLFFSESVSGVCSMTFQPI